MVRPQVLLCQLVLLQVCILTLMCTCGHSFILDPWYRQALSLAGISIFHGQVLPFVMLVLGKSMVFVSFHDVILWWVRGPRLLLLFLHLRELQAVLLLPLSMLSLAGLVLVGGVAIIRGEVFVH